MNSSKATVLAVFTINVFIFVLICAARVNVALLHVLSSAYCNTFRECIAHFCALLMNIFFCTQTNLNHFNPNIYNPSEVDQVFQIKRCSGGASGTVKASHLYLYSALYNTDCVKAALQFKQENSLLIMQEDNSKLHFSVKVSSLSDVSKLRAVQ